MKGITLCGDCAYYSMKKHCCTRGATKETDPRAKFYDDCPLPEAEPVRHGRWEWVGRWECTNCRGPRLHDLVLGLDAAYCGRCGAKMDGGNNDGAQV